MLREENVALDLPNEHVGTTYPKTPGTLQKLAAEAGVQFNGPDPWDIQMHDVALYERILTQGSLGFG